MAYFFSNATKEEKLVERNWELGRKGGIKRHPAARHTMKKWFKNQNKKAI